MKLTELYRTVKAMPDGPTACCRGLTLTRDQVLAWLRAKAIEVRDAGGNHHSIDITVSGLDLPQESGNQDGLSGQAIPETTTNTPMEDTNAPAQDC